MSMRRQAALSWGDQTLIMSTEEEDPVAEHNLVDVKGWYGGVGVDGDDEQRPLGHGLFPAPSRRTGRSLTLTGSLWYQDERDRAVANRFVSGILGDGQFGTLTVDDGLLELTATVKLDGEVQHSTAGDQWVDVQIPLLAPDPFLYAEERVQQLFPPGAGQGLEYDLFEDDVLSFGDDVGSMTVLENQGNAEAWPVFVVRGNFPSGLRIVGAGGVVEYGGPIFDTSPLTLDMRAGAAYVGEPGRPRDDRTHSMTTRRWFSIPARGRLLPQLHPLAPSNGWLDVHTRDTYI